MNDFKNQLSVQSLYVSNVYWIELPQFLDIARKISYEYLEDAKKSDDPIYPVKMTGPLDHQDLYPLIEYINQTGYNILQSQGHKMDNWMVKCREFWCQEHDKYSGHDEHVHAFNHQITGMYFLDVPKDSCQMVFHDPRPAKRQINMPEKEINDLTYATLATYYNPVPGVLYLTNSWLPHSFTKNKSDEPFRFIHFNLGVEYFDDSRKFNYASDAVIV